MPVQKPSEIDVNRLREAIKITNSLPFIEKRLRSAGVTTEQMRDSFLTTIEKLSDADLAKIPAAVGDTYNIIAGTAQTEPEVTKPEKETVKEEPVMTKKKNRRVKKTEPKEIGKEEPVSEEKAPPKKEKEPTKVEKTPTGRAPKAETTKGMRRTEAYAKILKGAKAPLTKKEIKDKMLTLFKGTESEAQFAASLYSQVLIDMGFAKLDEEGRVCLLK